MSRPPRTDVLEARAPELSKGMSWALALAATATMAVSYVDRQTLSVLAPVVTKSLHISDQEYGWLISAFSLAYLVGSPFAGRLIDFVGARRGLLGAVLVWSVVAALHALVPGFGVLFALRIALGLAESPSFPGAAQTIHRALPPADRARGFGILFTGSSFGAMLAPPLATFLESRWGFRVAFLGTALVGLLWVPVWLAFAWNRAARRALDHGDMEPVEPGDDSSKADLTRDPNTGTAKPNAGIAKPNAGIAEPNAGIAEPNPAPLAPLEPRPTMLDLLRHKAILRAIAVVVASAPMLSFALNWSSKFLVGTYGLAQKDVGGYLWLPPVFLDIGAVAFGHYASRRAKLRGNDGSPPRLLLAMAAVLTMAGAAIPFGRGPWEAILFASLAMAGGGGLFALITADMLARVHPSAVSSAGGISAAAQSLAYIVANPLIGSFVERTGSYRTILLWLGVWVIPGCLLWLLWSPPPPYSARSTGPAVPTR